MKKLMSFCLLASLVLIAFTARADTIHLKNGSVIKGKVASFADDQFVVVLDTGSSRYMSRAMIFIGDVARIEFDSAPTVATDPASQRDTPSSREPVASQPRDNDPSTRTTKLPDSQIREPATPPDPQPSSPPTREAVKEPLKDPEASVASPVSPTETSEAAPPPKKPGAVKTVNVDVAAKRDWTSTGLIVKRGDRIRINATGSVNIDPTNQHTSGPEGTDLADARKLMPDRPTGALIGVIGADNDDFIFVGKSAEFTATRDGLLFLSVNEGALSDNTGSYKATIDVQAQGGKRL
jgi:hypothetical protein